MCTYAQPSLGVVCDRPSLKPEPIVSRQLSQVKQQQDSLQASTGTAEVALIQEFRDQYNNRLTGAELLSNVTVGVQCYQRAPHLEFCLLNKLGAGPLFTKASYKHVDTSRPRIRW